MGEKPIQPQTDDAARHLAFAEGGLGPAARKYILPLENTPAAQNLL